MTNGSKLPTAMELYAVMIISSYWIVGMNGGNMALGKITCVIADVDIISSYHYGDVKMGAITSQITSLTIIYSTVFQTQIKENIKAPRHWPLCVEFTGDRWIPRTNGQLRGKCFHLMTSSCDIVCRSHDTERYVEFISLALSKIYLLSNNKARGVCMILEIYGKFLMPYKSIRL